MSVLSGPNLNGARTIAIEEEAKIRRRTAAITIEITREIITRTGTIIRTGTPILKGITTRKKTRIKTGIIIRIKIAIKRETEVRIKMLLHQATNLETGINRIEEKNPGLAEIETTGRIINK